jgi:hypothetical protein
VDANTSSSGDVVSRLTGPAFLMLNSLKLAVESLPITQVTSLIDVLRNEAPSLKSILKRFKIGSKLSEKLVSSVQLAKKFTGKYWKRAAQLLKNWEEIKSTNEMTV